MWIEEIEATETPTEKTELLAGEGFKSTSFSTMEALNTDLMPKIRFTTNPEEAEAAKNADRGDPLNHPESVFYVGPKDKAGDNNSDNTPGSDELADIPKFTRDESSEVEVKNVPKFQNDSFNIDVTKDGKFQNDSFLSAADIQNVIALAHEEEKRMVESGGDRGKYVGPSLETINFRLDEATKHLTYAEINLARAIANNTGVFSAQQMVDSARGEVEALLKLHEEAVKFRGV